MLLDYDSSISHTQHTVSSLMIPPLSSYFFTSHNTNLQHITQLITFIYFTSHLFISHYCNTTHNLSHIISSLSHTHTLQYKTHIDFYASKLPPPEESEKEIKPEKKEKGGDKKGSAKEEKGGKKGGKKGGEVKEKGVGETDAMPKLQGKTEVKKIKQNKE